MANLSIKLSFFLLTIEAKGRKDFQEQRKEHIKTLNCFLGILESKVKNSELEPEENFETRIVQQNKMWNIMKKYFLPCCKI